MRTPLQELSAVPLLPYLTVEHVLPQTWHSSDYPLASPDPQTLALRKMTIQTFGNLTLLTQPLNSSVSNGPFMDRTMNGTLVEGKRSGFRKSLLILNAYFQDPALTQWSDGEIAQRSDVLLRHARRLWPRPVMPQPVATVPTSDPTSA